MVKFTTPYGEAKAVNLRAAIRICTAQADEEAKNSTGIYQTLSNTTHIKITCNKKIWTIEKTEI